jgi:putative resolvase
VQHCDWLTRLGNGSIATLLEHQGRRVEAVFPTDTPVTVDDVVAVITSLAPRRCGRRNAKRRAAQIQACLKQGIEPGIERGVEQADTT